MGVLNFPGKLPVAIALGWKGDAIANPLDPAQSGFTYALANESLTEFSIEGKLGSDSIHLRRKAAPKKRLFDDKLNAYVTEPVSGAVLDKFLAGGGTFTIDFTFSYRSFFDQLLLHVTRTASDLNNLANPPKPSDVLDTFTHEGSGQKVKITFKSVAKTVTSLACKLDSFDVKPGAKGKPPAVKLVFSLDFLTGIDAARREIMRKLIAMDWSKLARFGKPTGKAMVDPVKSWYVNVLAWLLNHVDLARGEKIRQAILGRQKGKSAKDLSVDLRDDIDKHIITSNHWGESREDPVRETYQWKLSDLFGTIHQTAWFGSPVSFVRQIGDMLKFGDKDNAALILQFGTGHCGEHSTVSFSLLRDIIDAPGSKVSYAVQTGNANIDHAFVVYELEVDQVFRTLTTNKNNSRTSGAGKSITVWNLKDAIAKNSARTGYVMDPYLDQKVMKATAKELLAALHGKSRVKSGKDTDFLAFQDEYPVAPTTTDLTGKSEAERKKLVPNV